MPRSRRISEQLKTLGEWISLVLMVPREENRKATEKALFDKWRDLQLWLARQFGPMHSSMDMERHHDGWPYLHIRAASPKLLEAIHNKGFSPLYQLVHERAVQQGCGIFIWKEQVNLGQDEDEDEEQPPLRKEDSGSTVVG